MNYIFEQYTMNNAVVNVTLIQTWAQLHSKLLFYKTVLIFILAYLFTRNQTMGLTEKDVYF